MDSVAKFQTLNLSFEIANNSLYSAKIASYIEDYEQIIKQKYKDKVIIKYNFKNYEELNSSYYEIFITGEKGNENTLYTVSCGLRDKICKLEDFKNLVVITKDDANAKMCESLYPKILNIETRLRALTNRVLMQSLGKYWAQELEIKIKNVDDKRESGFNLNETTLETLISILFEETDKRPKHRKQNSKKRKNTNLGFVSMWQRFFPKIELKPDYMYSLKDVRNKVMHGKPMDYCNDYHKNIKNSEKIAKCLDSAEKQIVGKKFELSQDTIDSLNLLFNNMSKIFKQMKPFVHIMNEFSKKITSYYKSLKLKN